LLRMGEYAVLPTLVRFARWHAATRYYRPLRN
jgi:hypothetical protein